MKTDKPIILLFGMPRSGTTWIGKIFDSHPDTLYRHEPDTWIKINEIPLLPSVEEHERYCDFLSSYVSTFDTLNLPQVTSKQPLFKKNYSSWLDFNLYRMSVYVSSAVGRIRPAISLPTFNPASRGKGKDMFVIWKSIQLLGRMGVITRCLPGSRAVHIVRHPCGYISSVLRGEEKRKFVSATPASEDYDLFDKLLGIPQASRYKLDMDRFKAMAPVERLAWRWVLFNEKALDDTEGMAGVTRLRYEDLCASPVEKTRELFEATGLSWSGQTEDFLKKSTQVNNSSYYSVYKDPLEAAFRWKATMDSQDIERILSIAGQSRIGRWYLDEQGQPA